MQLLLIKPRCKIAPSRCFTIVEIYKFIVHLCFSHYFSNIVSCTDRLRSNRQVRILLRCFFHRSFSRIILLVHRCCQTRNRNSTKNQEKLHREYVIQRIFYTIEFVQARAYTHDGRVLQGGFFRISVF